MRVTCFIVATVLLHAADAARPAPEQAVSLSSDVMGTGLSLTVVAGGIDRDVIADDLEAALERVRAVESRMSTRRNDSEISRLNRIRAGEVFHASPQLARVLRLGLEVSRLTEGGFDMTILPLVERWGFIGKPASPFRFPSEEEIAELGGRVGWRHVSIDAEGKVRLSRNAMMLDLGGIAKGFGVDVAFDYLSREGYDNILVEIGGETRSAGNSPSGRTWRIGISNPRPDPANPFITVVDGSETAVATSGDYEDFFFHEGKRYSHVIDPVSGRPVRNGVCSATVLAGECAYADALATALMVLGVEGLSLVDTIPGVEALMAVRNADDTISLFYSEGMMRQTRR